MVSKQEEIREWFYFNMLRLGEMGYFEATLEILQFLDSQGCVLKVERELPTVFNPKGGVKTALWYKEDIIKASYVAVEPLIERK